MSNPILRTRGCRWISVPGAADARGHVNFLSFDDKLGFTPKRLFWLHHIAPGQWRGRHGHELTDFTPQSVILVIASTLYDEAEYLRDYDTFKRIAAGIAS